ncbi:MAG TPA: hypothetical protein VL981_03780 [Candidatus Methylacidiphilales bacterium]|nr:hypothetical protein [Candidatus Methylacidiphilales bacterium]
MTNLLISFGSQARGEADSYSDTDLLEVTDVDSNDFKAASTLLMSQDRLLAASQTGSLFIKHVFSEGRLVAGTATDFAALTRSWQSAASYQDEIEENRDLLKLLAYVSSNQAGLAAAVDITICALRSILIRLLAERGEYLFSWAKLAERSLSVGLIHPRGPALIQAARRLKNLYRSGKDVIVPHSFVGTLIEATQPALGHVRLNVGGVVPYDLPDRCPERSYKQLRAMELVRAAHPNDRSFDRWSAWIADPRRFCIKAGY